MKSVLAAIRDPNLFRPYLAPKLKPWRSWVGGVLPCIFGLSVDARCHDLITEATKRDINKLPATGFKRSVILCGRRSGKSKIAGLIAAYIAAMSGLEKQLSPGEKGYVACLAPTKQQATIVHSYIKGALSSPLLSAEIVEDNKESLTLSNGVVIQTFAGSFRHARGFTLLGAVVDEICFFRHGEECDLTAKELVRALRPALSTIRGSKLIAIGSKYSMDGWAFETWKKFWAEGDANASSTLVWDAMTTAMNPTIPQSEIDDAMAEDPESARAEFLNQWREDVAAFLPRSTVEACVIKNRIELLPRPAIGYSAFVDMSGGRNDDAGLAIAHRPLGGKITVDKVVRYKPPFDPYSVIAAMAKEMDAFGITRCRGDRYSAEFVTRAFRNHRVNYQASEKSKSDLYLEALPLLCGGQIELPDNPILIDQFSNLERRVRAGGKDIVDHPRGGHDDLSNVVAGVAYSVGRPALRIGGLGVLRPQLQQQQKPDQGLAVAQRRALLARLMTPNGPRSLI
jgi:hypothetical protein